MSGDIGRQSSSDVAHEAEGTRAHLASTLEQLRNNLRPENVMEEVVSNARIGAASVADNIAGVAKQYPIPAVLIAAGSALIMRVFARRPSTRDVTGFESTGGGDPGPGRRPGLRASTTRPSMLRNPTTFEPAPGRSELRTSKLGQAIGEARGGAIDALAGGSAALRSRASDAYRSTSSQAGDAMRSLSHALPHDRVEARSKLSNLLEEQPLILGVIGLAIGAAIGAALPITDTEDGLMGQTAHRLRDSASDAARHEIDGLRAVATEAVQNVRHAASDNLQGFVKDVGDSARTAVDKAGDTVVPKGEHV